MPCPTDDLVGAVHDLLLHERICGPECERPAPCRRSHCRARYAYARNLAQLCAAVEDEGDLLVEIVDSLLSRAVDRYGDPPNAIQAETIAESVVELSEAATEVHDCPRCGGDGRIWDGTGGDEPWEECRACDSTGEVSGIRAVDIEDGEVA